MSQLKNYETSKEMPRITFILSTGDRTVINASLSEAISQFFEKNAVALLQGARLSTIQVGEEQVKEGTIIKLLDKFYKQYNISSKKSNDVPSVLDNREQDFIGKCKALRETLERWTAQIDRIEWPTEVDGREIHPDTIKNTFQSAVQLGLKVDPILEEFVQGLQEDH